MLAWIGTISSILGSFLVAFGILFYGYIAFITGCTSWLVIAAMRRDKPLAALNMAFMVANIIGIIRYM